jgi:hypothetical protein
MSSTKNHTNLTKLENGNLNETYKQEEKCWKDEYWIYIIFFLIMSGLISLCVIESLHLGQTEHQCTITYTEYPKTMPLDNTHMDNFVTCDCGYRCTTDLGICTRVYVTVDNDTDTQHMLRDSDISPDYNCTFAETSCRGGERAENRFEMIRRNIIDIDTNYGVNNTIPCFLDKDTYYTTYNVSNETIEAFIIVISGSIMIFICVGFKYRRNSK